MCLGVVNIECPNPLDEGLHAALLEDAHEGRAESLGSIRRNLGNGGLVTVALLDEATGDLSEFKVTGDIGGDKDVGQLARGHEELGDQVDVPVVGTAVLLPRLFTVLEVAIFLEELEDEAC